MELLIKQSTVIRFSSTRSYVSLMRARGFYSRESIDISGRITFHRGTPYRSLCNGYLLVQLFSTALEMGYYACDFAVGSTASTDSARNS